MKKILKLSKVLLASLAINTISMPSIAILNNKETKNENISGNFFEKHKENLTFFSEFLYPKLKTSALNLLFFSPKTIYIGDYLGPHSELISLLIN